MPIKCDNINKFDIVHLHWINNGFFSFYFEKRLKNKGKIYAFDGLENLIKLNNEFKKQYNLKINFEYSIACLEDVENLVTFTRYSGTFSSSFSFSK